MTNTSLNYLHSPHPEPRPLRLALAGGHQLYAEISGNPCGIPAVFLHGGPGSGCQRYHQRFFDPARYQTVLFDQRGSGKSRPRGDTRYNTTQLLIEDMEALREHLGMERWLLVGGSWGAALGLAYAQQHPRRVSGLILRGSFLARQQDLDWFAQRGASELFPRAWRRFVQPIPAQERDDLVGAYHHRVHGPNPAQQAQFALAWNQWSNAVARRRDGNDAAASVGSLNPAQVQRLIAKVRIETHYGINRYFLEHAPLLENCHRLPDVPITLIHGAADQVCPIAAAHALKTALPQAELIEVADGGHLAEEPAIGRELVSACDRFADSN